MTARSVRFGAPLLAVAASLAALSIAASPVLGDTELGDHGKVGDHYLNDQAGFAGATCHYSDGDTLTSIDINSPNVWARNTTAQRDHQKIGWQVIVRRRINSGTWKTIATFQPTTARAYDNASAFLQGTDVSFLPGPPAGKTAKYQIQIKILWYRHGSVEGWSLHRVDRYLEDNGASTRELSGGCNWNF